MASVAALLLLGAAAATRPATGLPAAARAAALLRRMTLDEKIEIVHGVAGYYIGNVPGNARLGIPPLNMNDGPQGFRAADSYNGTTTQWPCGLAMAATWDAPLVEKWGAAMATEFRGKGANVQLGPGVCIGRVPRGGRNFEYISGEDPLLGAQLAGSVVRGIQSQGVIATAKHYVNNNQEVRHRPACAAASGLPSAVPPTACP